MEAMKFETFQVISGQIESRKVQVVLMQVNDVKKS